MERNKKFYHPDFTDIINIIISYIPLYQDFDSITQNSIQEIYQEEEQYIRAAIKNWIENRKQNWPLVEPIYIHKS